MIGTAYAAAAEHASSGLPQFETSTFTSQAFWAAASFVALLFLLRKYVLPGIQDVLDARAREIEDDMASARKEREEAERTLAEYRQQLSNARDVAAQNLDEARQEAVRIREKALAELETEIAKKRTAATEEIEMAKRKAMADLQQMAVDVAMMAAEKLIAKSVTKTDANRMVDQAIQDLQGTDKAVH